MNHRRTSCLRRCRSGSLQRIACGAVIASLVFVGEAAAFRGGPLPARDGSTAAGGNSCRECHGSTLGGGSVQILGFPAQYQPDVIYNISIRISDAIQRGAGFQASVQTTGGQPAGTVIRSDFSNTQLNQQNVPNVWRGINHTSTGVNNAVAAWASMGNSATYNFQWRAPPDDAGTVTAWAAGNAINNDFSNGGDRIYLGSVSAVFGGFPEGACCAGGPCQGADTCASGYETCGGDLSCYCFELAAGGEHCTRNFLCDHVQCPNGHSDCPAGQHCFVNTCCVVPTCGVPGCPPPSGASAAEEGDPSAGMAFNRPSNVSGILPGAGPCLNMSRSDCDAIGGIFRGEGTTCETVDPACEPPTGACCNGNNGLCADGVTEDACVADQLSWSPGMACDALDPPCAEHTGACCDGLSGECSDDVPGSQCSGPQQSWTKGADCGGVACAAATGACCDRLSGECSDGVPGSQCSGPQQSWTKGADCGVVACDAATGACCDYDAFGGCSDGVTVAQCGCATCEWSKGRACGQVACVLQTIPTVSEWGLAILALCLLTGAKIAFRSRVQVVGE